MKYGIVVNKKWQEEVWSHGLKELNKQIRESGSPDWRKDYLITTEAPLNPLKAREDMVDFFANQQNFKGVYVGSTAILAMYSYRSHTGLVLDIGDGSTHIVPIFEGYALPHAIKRLDLGGADLTTFFARLLTERKDNKGRRFVSTAEQEIV